MTESNKATRLVGFCLGWVIFLGLAATVLSLILLAVVSVWRGILGMFS